MQGWQRLLVTCFGIGLIFAASGAVWAGDRVALVIGNDHYDNLPATQQLAKAVNDSRSVGDALAKLGFSVMRSENLSRQEMIDQIFAFTQKIKPGDMAALFFAGHGVALGGSNFLLPTDVRTADVGQEARVRNMAIGEADIVADIQERKAAVTLLILDACRDNPFQQPGLTRGVGATRGLTRVPEAEGVFSIYSAGYGQTALDSLGGGDASPNSVFTRVLVPKLAKPQTHLADLMIDIRQDVAKLASSVGHEQNPAYYDQTRGGRIFLGDSPRPVAEPEPKKQEAKQEDVAMMIAPPIPSVPPADRRGSVGRVWHVMEVKPGDENNAWYGEWTRRGSSDVFDAIHFDGTKRYFDISTQEMSINGRRITALRRAPRAACTYEGTLSEDGLHASGTYGCNNVNDRRIWKATIDNNLPKAIEDDWRGQVWEEIEDKEWVGIWKRRGQSAIFDGQWRHPNGGFDIAALYMTIEGDDVTIRRDQEKGRCTYWGKRQPDGHSVVGKVQCDWGGQTLYPWRASIKH